MGAGISQLAALFGATGPAVAAASVQDIIEQLPEGEDQLLSGQLQVDGAWKFATHMQQSSSDALMAVAAAGSSLKKPSMSTAIEDLAVGASGCSLKKPSMSTAIEDLA